MVAKLAAEAGYDVHVARAKDLDGPNLHARARAFRYSFFETIAREVEQIGSRPGIRSTIESRRPWPGLSTGRGPRAWPASTP